MQRKLCTKKGETVKEYIQLGIYPILWTIPIEV